MFEGQVMKLGAVISEAHQSFYDSGVFAGPSLYFHLEALQAAKEENLHGFAEKVYAVLAACGMHRMGRGGSKMCDFDDFERTLTEQWAKIIRLRRACPEDIDEPAWAELEEIFCCICCMKTGTSLVGNSKVMAHALPNLIPPVDREYTLRFLYGNGNIKNGKEGEWQRLRQMLTGFFYPFLRLDEFRRKASEWMRDQDQYVWDTSSLKIVDNLIIGTSKRRNGDSRLEDE